MIPLLPSLPLLIKDTVEFYYYRQKWLERIKIMHEQYRKHVGIHHIDQNKYIVTWTVYTNDDKISNRVVNGNFTYWERNIFSFTRLCWVKYNRKRFPVPRKYQ
jgi:hypothetical protein